MHTQEFEKYRALPPFFAHMWQWVCDLHQRLYVFAHGVGYAAHAACTVQPVVGCAAPSTPVAPSPQPAAPTRPSADPFAPYLTRQSCIRTIANCGDPTRAEANIEFLEKLLPKDLHDQLRDDIEAKRSDNEQRRHHNDYKPAAMPQQITVTGDLVIDKHVDSQFGRFDQNYQGLSLPLINIKC